MVNNVVVMISTNPLSQVSYAYRTILSSGQEDEMFCEGHGLPPRNIGVSHKIYACR